MCVYKYVLKYTRGVHIARTRRVRECYFFSAAVTADFMVPLCYASTIIMVRLGRTAGFRRIHRVLFRWRPRRTLVRRTAITTTDHGKRRATDPGPLPRTWVAGWIRPNLFAERRFWCRQRARPRSPAEFFFFFVGGSHTENRTERSTIAYAAENEEEKILKLPVAHFHVF